MRKWGRAVLATIAVLILAALGLPYLVFRGAAINIPGASAGAEPLIHVVGWNGPTGGDRDFLNALREAGCEQSMETFDWTDGQRGLFAYWRAKRSREPAMKLAARINALWDAHPGRPIYITADSTGGAVVIAALELLPANVNVDKVILASPPLSRGYDLGPALAHVHGFIVSLNSDRDNVILGLGMWIFGTVDGKHESAAGRIGFDVRSDPNYEKLSQWTYDPAWKADYGHNGGHAQALLPTFAKEQLSSLLK